MYLSETYKAMYPSASAESNISSGVYKYSQFKLGNEIFGSQGTRSKRSSYILARWYRCTGVLSLRPAHVLYYFKHSAKVHASLQPHFFAAVQWFKPHPTRDTLGNPLELWCHDLFEPQGPSSYLPLQSNESKFVAAVHKLQVETLLIVMPLQLKTYL